MSKKEIKITARIHNYSLPSRKEDNPNSLLLTIQTSDQTPNPHFPLPTKILIPHTEENKPLLENIVKAIRQGKEVLLDGTYTFIPPNILAYCLAKAHEHFFGNKRILGESAVRTYTGLINIDGLDFYEINYHCHKGNHVFKILNTL